MQRFKSSFTSSTRYTTTALESNTSYRYRKAVHRYVHQYVMSNHGCVVVIYLLGNMSALADIFSESLDSGKTYSQNLLVLVKVCDSWVSKIKIKHNSSLLKLKAKINRYTLPHAKNQTTRRHQTFKQIKKQHEPSL